MATDQLPLGFALSDPEFRRSACSALNRIAAALETIALAYTGTDLAYVEPDPAELAALSARDDSMQVETEELYAVIERAAAEGRAIPLSAYRRLGIEPPDNRERDVEIGTFDALQPGAGRPDDGPVVYRKGDR